jgi:hypothetical protein
MPLIDRVFHDDPDPTRWVANHSFSATLWFWARGEVTRAQVISAFNMTTEDEVQLDELKAHYDGLPTNEKTRFHSDLEAAGVLAETGLITKTLYKSFLGLTP